MEELRGLAEFEAQSLVRARTLNLTQVNGSGTAVGVPAWDLTKLNVIKAHGHILVFRRDCDRRFRHGERMIKMTFRPVDEPSSRWMICAPGGYMFS
jgi:hypothetical protein